MKTFKINNKEYNAKEFDFNLICDLEDMGISIEQASRKPMSMVRAYFGLCSGLSRADAGKEIESHLIAGGKFDDIMSAMSEQMENSDFFQAISKTSETEDSENQSETEEKK